MKNVTIALLLMLSVLSFAQDSSNKKFQVGVSYSLTSEDELFRNPFSGYVNYQITKWDKLNLNAGLRFFYYGSKESDYLSNKLGFNPNASISHFFAKKKLNANFALGYYFDSFETDATIIGNVISPKRDIKTNGISISPGLKYFIHPKIFIDANATFLLAKTKDDFYKDTSGNNTFINLGLGVAF